MSKISEYILNEWNPPKNEEEKKNAFAISKSDFEEIALAPKIKDNEDVVIISIECTEGCIAYYQNVKNEDINGEHLLESSERVLNINFDDTHRDFMFEDGKYIIKAITEEQGKEIYDFLCKNQDKNIIVHCSAGISRSQGVIRSIFDMFHNYEECEVNKLNPCKTPNYEVIYKIKKNYYQEN